MEISKIMVRKVTSVDENALIGNVLGLMDSKGIKEIPVISKKKCVGLLFYYDLISGDINSSKKAKEAMKKVPMLRAKDSLIKTIKLMQESGVGALPVVDEDDKLVGIVSDYDVLKVLISNRVFDSLKVDDVVIRRFPVVRTEDTIARAQKLAAINKIDNLPIIDGFGRVIGQVTLSDILRYIFSKSPLNSTGKRDIKRENALEQNITEISRKELPQIPLNLNLRKALEIMLSSKMKGVVVVDTDGKPVGVLSRMKILDLLGGKNIGDNINIELSGDYDWDFVLLVRSQINRMESRMASIGGINTVRIHVKKVHDITGKYQINVLCLGKKRINIKVEGVIKEALMDEAIEKIENFLEHLKRN
ncbi:CBS domain-containing protein [Candidatus Parvarchaeota archaeon]|jgi:predicted transcriptional regulator|nr:CBS domain-containing protein [Candidatus Parvarchaeota archaeon]